MNNLDTNKAEQLRENVVITGALISMSNYILNQTIPTHLEIHEFEDAYHKIYNYANFLRQPIMISMFVPFVNGKVLKGKPLSPNTDAEWIRWENEQEDFYKAKELVLFENFEVKTKIAFNNGYEFVCDNNEIFYPFWYNPVKGWELSKGLKTIEDLIIYQPKLTENVLSEYFS